MNKFEKDFANLIHQKQLSNGNESDAQAIQIIAHLKKNPPKESYENPKFISASCTKQERDLINQILFNGIDLPGSKHNPYGCGYFTDFFMDMYFGNYTEFMEHVDKMTTSNQLKRALKRREGYCQFSVLFAPLLGLRLVNLDDNLCLSEKDRKETRMMYNVNNENKHLEILQTLLTLGADPNAHDTGGFTPLHYAIGPFEFERQSEYVKVLLEYGANPNAENRNGLRPVAMWPDSMEPEIVDLLIQYKAKPKWKHEANLIRSAAEASEDAAFTARVREAIPREEKECERCESRAEKKCSACRATIFYCSVSCQKLDWKHHKITCRKYRHKKQ